MGELVGSTLGVEVGLLEGTVDGLDVGDSLGKEQSNQ